MFFPNLKKLRDENHLTQQQIGDYLHCNRQVYGKYERGQRELPFSYAIELSKLYLVSLDYIAGLSKKRL